MSQRLRSAAIALIAHAMVEHDLWSIDELECPHMRALAEALKPRRQRGPGKPKRGLGGHTNSDMFSGL